MRLRVDGHPAAAALRIHGSADGDPGEGLIFAPHPEIADWASAEEELAEAFRLTQAAFAAAAPVVYLVEAAALLGRAEPLPSAVAAGLLGGARALAFEGRKEEAFATVIAIGAGAAPEQVSDAVGCAVAVRSGNGQVVAVGAEHLGAMFP
ncbi:MAG: hypothetical protein JSU06_05115 [Actinobacteria bacterium]|nr:hypothetical protein [Actinomycetota bacterium]